MIYLICQDWQNTANNHAGMKHMCNLLKDRFPTQYELVVLPEIKAYELTTLNKIKYEFIFKIVEPVHHTILAFQFLKKIKDGDEVWLLEYMELLSPQYYFASIIKKHKRAIKIFGLIHLTPHSLENIFSKNRIEKWLKPIDTVLTLGSSLSKYLINNGISEDKVKTLFHYVDLDYYDKKARDIKRKPNMPLKVIAMGNQKRNYDTLYKIIEANPNVYFTLCKGMNNIDHLFSTLSNVKLVGFVPESELKLLMDEADVSLNVMYDTIGSNVITTSLAMGLAIITSDVGSIRDYCDDTNTFFCYNNAVESFSEAINYLAQHRHVLFKMQESALLKAQSFSIDQFHKELN